MILGLDLLLAGNYPEEALRGFPKGYALGVIWRVNGVKPAKSVVKKIVESGKCNHVRVHLIWKDNHDFTAADIPETLKRADAVAELAAAFPDVVFYISPWLENRADTALLTKLFRQLRKRLPRYIRLVNSGDNMPALPDVMREVHHSANSANVFSNDGESFSKSKYQVYQKVHKNCHLFFGWDWIFNQRKDENDKTPRPQRTLKPTVKQIRQIAKHMV